MTDTAERAADTTTDTATDTAERPTATADDTSERMTQQLTTTGRGDDTASCRPIARQAFTSSQRT